MYALTRSPTIAIWFRCRRQHFHQVPQSNSLHCLHTKLSPSLQMIQSSISELRISCHLTLSPPIALRLYALPYTSNTLILIFESWALAPPHPNVKN